jgi:AcrR family transcriptional regulator
MDDMAEAVLESGAAAAREIDKPAADDGKKRRQIIEGAREIFMSAGFDAASMNDIARAAGVSKGTLYAYFDSKVALFEALIREERAHQPERNVMFPADEPDATKALATYGRLLVEKITRTDKLEQARIVAFAAARFPSLGRAFYEAGPLYGAVKLKERLDAFVAAGKLQIDDTTVAARQFIDLCLGDILKRLLFRVVDTVEQDEIDLLVGQSVAMFMKVYGAPKFE